MKLLQRIILLEKPIKEWLSYFLEADPILLAHFFERIIDGGLSHGSLQCFLNLLRGLLFFGFGKVSKNEFLSFFRLQFLLVYGSSVRYNCRFQFIPHLKCKQELERV